MGGVWDNVLLLETSDFARTLTPNGGAGTDHAWSGNYFITGGGVDGGQILGQYPSDLKSGPYRVARGRLIPRLSWDSIWNGVAQWFGLTDQDELDEILPNRNEFNNLFSESDLFIPGVTEAESRKNLR